MSNFTDLVPPLELCRMIPAGEFEDSYAAYFWDANGANITLDKRVGDAIWKDVVIAPAPTLQEIMVEIDNLGGWCPTAYRLQNQWTVDYQEDEVDGMNDIVEQTDPDNPAAAALKLLFKLKGIEMSNKNTCGDCRHISADCLYCKNHLSTLASRDQVSPFCGEWEPKTNGDRIRQMSNEELAELIDNSCKACAKDVTACDTDCVNGILAWLNAPADVCVKQNENDDTQPDLCTADNTESEVKNE